MKTPTSTKNPFKKPLDTLSDLPFDIQETEEMVEVVDNQGTTFMIMPLSLARKKKMPRRIFFIILKDNKNRVLLVKRKSLINPLDNMWTLSASGSVLAGESAEGAALRELRSDFHLEDIPLLELSTLPFMENETKLSASIFLAGPLHTQIKSNEEKVEDFMFLNKGELTGLLLHEPEMFDPLLVWALRSGWIF